MELFEAFTGFETANAYEMYGEDGNPIYQLAESAPLLQPGNTKGYSSTYLAMGFANVRAGTRYPPEH